MPGAAGLYRAGSDPPGRKPTCRSAGAGRSAGPRVGTRSVGWPRPVEGRPRRRMGNRPSARLSGAGPLHSQCHACARRLMPRGDISWWTMQRRGYLNSCMIGYALAVFAWVREERRPDWAQFLRLDAARDPGGRPPLSRCHRRLVAWPRDVRHDRSSSRLARAAGADRERLALGLRRRVVGIGPAATRRPRGSGTRRIAGPQASCTPHAGIAGRGGAGPGPARAGRGTGRRMTCFNSLRTEATTSARQRHTPWGGCACSRKKSYRTWWSRLMIGTCYRRSRQPSPPTGRLPGRPSPNWRRRC